MNSVVSAPQRDERFFFMILPVSPSQGTHCILAVFLTLAIKLFNLDVVSCESQHNSWTFPPSAATSLIMGNHVSFYCNGHIWVERVK